MRACIRPCVQRFKKLSSFYLPFPFSFPLFFLSPLSFSFPSFSLPPFFPFSFNLLHPLFSPSAFPCPFLFPLFLHLPFLFSFPFPFLLPFHFPFFIPFPPLPFYARKQNASRVFAIIWASVHLSVCHTRELHQNGAS